MCEKIAVVLLSLSDFRLTQFDDMESAGSRPKDDVSLPKGMEPIKQVTAIGIVIVLKSCSKYPFQSCGDVGVLIEGRMLGAMLCSNDDQDY